MPRRMSCWLTKEQVRDESKDVTRRHEDTWTDLKPGDRLTLIEKGMGLPKGSKQVVLKEVEVTSVRVEPLHLIDEDECRREGFPNMEPEEFAVWWAESHGHRWSTQNEFMAIKCRRIAWRYLDAPPSPTLGGRDR